MRDWARRYVWPENVWAGTSVESPDYVARIEVLRDVPAPVRFISAEPLLAPLDLTPWLHDGTVNWVIVGGESGPNARPMDVAWAEDVVRQCRGAGVPVFVKQLGGYPDKRGGGAALVSGQVWHEMPDKPREAARLNRQPALAS